VRILSHSFVDEIPQAAGWFTRGLSTNDFVDLPLKLFSGFLLSNLVCGCNLAIHDFSNVSILSLDQKTMTEVPSVFRLARQWRQALFSARAESWSSLGKNWIGE
jgi:hypothetical protein